MKEAKDKETWCVISIENAQEIARIAYIGREKFRIFKDQSSEHADKEIDTSDVFDCRE